MKRFNSLIVLGVILLAALLIYANHLNKIKARRQHDPAEAVAAFMDAAIKISNLLWDEATREALRRDLKAWREGEELPEGLARYGLKDPSHLFRDPRFGKAAFSTVCLYQFDSYDLRPAPSAAGKATVQVSFLPQDFMGLQKLTSALGVPRTERDPQPVNARFRLEKHWGAWYIVGVEDEMAEAITAFGRLRGVK